MLIRFFKEFDLIGCGGDTQPIRLQHSDNQITGAHRGCAHRGCACRGCIRGGACAGVVGYTQPIRLQVHAGGVHAGDVCAGGVHAGVVGTLSQSDYRWGHSANQITGAAGGVRTGVVGTLSQSDYTGLHARMHVQGLCAGGMRTGGACKGVVGTLSQSDYTGLCVQGVRAQGWWEHLANQITQGCAHRGCACRGCACRGGGDT